MYKVRFHLAKGPNYQKWQVKYGRIVEYYDPETTVLTMVNCTLRNYAKAAQKICDGANKNVCAWITCEFLSVTTGLMVYSVEKTENTISYNPQKFPFWRNKADENIDGVKFETIYSIGRNLYLP